MRNCGQYRDEPSVLPRDLQARFHSLCAARNDAETVFTVATDPDLIDAAIYRLSAIEAQMAAIIKEARSVPEQREVTIRVATGPQFFQPGRLFVFYYTNGKAILGRVCERQGDLVRLDGGHVVNLAASSFEYAVPERNE